MLLIDQCVKALGEPVVVLSPQETRDVRRQLRQKVPFTFWGRIDWEHVNHVVQVRSLEEILPILLENGREEHDGVFILWDETTRPALLTVLQSVIRHIETVLMVSFDTWIINRDEHYVIEFYHEDEITIGFFD
jgi:hypothetical protein